MAVLGNTIINKFLGLSEAEEAFQPWWETIEDYTVYGLILLGKVYVICSEYCKLPNVLNRKVYECVYTLLY